MMTAVMTRARPRIPTTALRIAIGVPMVSVGEAIQFLLIHECTYYYLVLCRNILTDMISTDSTHSKITLKEWYS